MSIISIPTQLGTSIIFPTCPARADTSLIKAPRLDVKTAFCDEDIHVMDD